MSLLTFPKKSFDIEKSDFNELGVPINEMMYISSQYQIVDKFEDKEEFERLKLRFNAVLGKTEEEIWSLVKIVKVLKFSKDVLFKGVLQNFKIHFVRANNVSFEFSVVDFPLMNINDLINVSKY